MEGSEWRPRSIRQSAASSGFDVLHEGVPDWLESSIWRWLMDRIEGGGGLPMLERLERRLHIVLTRIPDRPYRPNSPPSSLVDRHWKVASVDEQLDLLDAVLADMYYQGLGFAESGRDDLAAHMITEGERLNTYLTEGGAVWGANIGAPMWGLVRRVNEATGQLIAAVGSADTDAARKIKAAWTACYRLHPDYDSAYRDAVLAVEALTIPITIPGSTRASLGGVTAHIRDTAQHWSVGGLDAKEVRSVDTLTTMMETLWHNHERHARQDGSIHDVTRPEAEAAVSLAVVLAHWFASGLAARDDRGL